MAISKTWIVSQAITKLGHAPIVSLIDGDSLVVAAEQAFNMLYPASLAQSNWRFATQIQQLSQSVETPPPQWNTVYLLPADWIKTLRVYPNIYAWDIYENSKIYAQIEGEFWMEYVFEPNVAKLPMYYVQYFVNELAAYLALSSAQHMDYYAQLEQKRIATFAQAAAIDSQNRPQSSQYAFPVLNNRYLGTIIGNKVSS